MTKPTDLTDETLDAMTQAVLDAFAAKIPNVRDTVTLSGIAWKARQINRFKEGITFERKRLTATAEQFDREAFAKAFEAKYLLAPKTTHYAAAICENERIAAAYEAKFAELERHFYRECEQHNIAERDLLKERDEALARVKELEERNPRNK